jgi:cytochrome b
LLVLAFAVAYLSAEEESGGPSAWHVWSGYVIGGIVVLRVLWGFIGSSHARFRDFVYGPGQVVRYLASLLTGHPRRYLGHSPAGGAMAVALLVCLAGTVATGLIAYGEEGKGPLAGIASVVTTSAQADQDASSAFASAQEEPKREEGALEEVHGVLANVTLTLVAFHILGVFVSSLVHRENLVAAMIHGRKRPED